jgi:hypothetical protein
MLVLVEGGRHNVAQTCPDNVNAAALRFGCEDSEFDPLFYSRCDF